MNVYRENITNLWKIRWHEEFWCESEHTVGNNDWNYRIKELLANITILF